MQLLYQGFLACKQIIRNHQKFNESNCPVNQLQATLFFYKQRFFSTQPQCCLIFS